MKTPRTTRRVVDLPVDLARRFDRIAKSFADPTRSRSQGKSAALIRAVEAFVERADSVAAKETK